MMAILNQESSLMEIVKLIGSDVLPDDQKLSSRSPRLSVWDSFSRMHSIKDDTCVPIRKQFLMMDLILYLNTKVKSPGYHGYADVHFERKQHF